MKRRDFLRYLAGASFGAGTFTLNSPLRPFIRSAFAATDKTLVVIFQRGANDGLNTVVPYGEDNYYSLRPKIAVAPPNTGDPESAIDLDGFFGLHPSLDALWPIYQQGDLAVLPTVHYDNASQSHFDSQAFIESGTTHRTADGWLSRHLDIHKPTPDQWGAVNFGHSINHSMRGYKDVSTFNNISDYNLGVPVNEEPELMDALAQVYNEKINSQIPYRDLLNHSGQVMLHDLVRITALDSKNYHPSNSAEYPNTTFGHQLMQTALLVKSGMEPKTITLNLGGWDTHQNQGGGNPNGQQARRLRDFGDGIAALYQDLGAHMQNVIVLTMTEFGRTAKQNGSLGTDHGNASTWFVVGKSTLQGGIYLGPMGWPGLSKDHLYKGRYLAHTIDYRDILAEILTHHMASTQISSILPDHNYIPIGFL